MTALIWKPVAAMEQARVVVPCGVEYVFTPGVPKDVAPEHRAFVLAALQHEQGTLAAPSAPTVVTQGTAGAATWGYKVVAVGADGDSIPSAQGQATNGNATLSGGNNELITRAALPTGATGWRVLRTAHGTTPGTGTSGSPIDISGVLASATTTFTDNGIAGVAYTAASSAPGFDQASAGPADL